MTQQLSIRFPQTTPGFDDMAITSANQAAIAAIRQVGNWPCNVLCLLGPPRSGLTTIAVAWANERGGQYMSAQALSVYATDQFAGLPGNDIAIDRADMLAHPSVLLALLGASSRHGSHIVLTAQTPPTAWSTDSPDLASRLKAVPVVQLFQPDEALMRARLRRACQCAYLDMKPPVEDYLVVRLGLDYACIDDTVDALAGLAANQALTIPLVRAILGQTSMAEDLP